MLWLEQTWEVAAWEITQLGSCYLGKYPWEVAAWENALRKVHTIIFDAVIRLRYDRADFYN